MKSALSVVADPGGSGVGVPASQRPTVVAVGRLDSPAQSGADERQCSPPRLIQSAVVPPSRGRAGQPPVPPTVEPTPSPPACFAVGHSVTACSKRAKN